MLKSKKCDLIIGDSAFKPAYSTLQELTISHTHLGSDHKAFLHFLSNLKHFKNLSRLNIQDNMIQSIDHCMVPQSVKTMDISRNNFTCNSSTVNELKCLKEKRNLDLKKEGYQFCFMKSLPLQRSFHRLHTAMKTMLSAHSVKMKKTCNETIPS